MGHTCYGPYYTMYRLWLMWLINCASNVPLNGTKKCFPIDVYHCFLVGFLFFSHLFFNGKKINWCINTFRGKYFPYNDMTVPILIVFIYSLSLEFEVISLQRLYHIHVKCEFASLFIQYTEKIGTLFSCFYNSHWMTDKVIKPRIPCL